MRRPVSTTRDSAGVLLVQPCDDGLHMYAELLSYHELTVIAVSNATRSGAVAEVRSAARHRV
jgi:hypothetical protein